jgi:hypothetical protein
MTKSKTIAAALAALTLATALTVMSGEAQARPRFATGLGIGLAAGALVGIAASSTYIGPAYVEVPAYRDCRLAERYDRWGNLRTVRVCDAPY